MTPFVRVRTYRTRNVATLDVYKRQVDACYQTWWELQCQVEDYYSDGKKRLRPPLSQQKEFRQIKNAVIREAEHIRMNKFSFEDEEMQDCLLYTSRCV